MAAPTGRNDGPPFDTFLNSVWYPTPAGWIEQVPNNPGVGVLWTGPTDGFVYNLGENGIWQPRRHRVTQQFVPAPLIMRQARHNITQGQPTLPPPPPATAQAPAQVPAQAPAPASVAAPARSKKSGKHDRSTISNSPTRPPSSWSGDSRNRPFRNGGARWPRHRAQYQELRQSFTETPHRNYGGTRGDGAVMNWALAGASAITAAVVAAFSYQFLQAYAENDGAGPQDFKYAYYACQALFALSILTAVLLALYVLWVFVDSRHPMRKAYLTLSDNNRGNVQSGRGKTAQWPSLGTMSLEKVSRVTTHRLYAKQAHIKKMLAVYGIFLIIWCVPFLIAAKPVESQQQPNIAHANAFVILPSSTTLANGYVTYRQNKTKSEVKIVEICGIEKSKDLCWHLAKAGITSGIMTALLALSLIVTAVALQARPTFGTTRTRRR